MKVFEGQHHGEETIYGRVPRKGKSHDQNQILILFYSRILIERLCVNYVNRVYIIYMHHEVCIKSTAGGGFCKTSDVKRLRSSER